MTELLPSELANAWDAAQTELTKAKIHYRKPGMDDRLADVRDRLVHAHARVADVYDAVRVELTLPDILAAALRDASEFHRGCSAEVPER